MALVLLLLVVAGATAWYLHRGDSSPATQTLAPCPTPAPTTAPTTSPAALPANAQVHVAVLNGTVRQGLAHTVATELQARGFVVVRQDNYPRAVTGPSVVSFPPALKGAATVLARNVLGARLAESPHATSGYVQVVLGSDFRRVATPAEVTAAAAAGTGAAVVPAPAPSGTRAPCAA